MFTGAEQHLLNTQIAELSKKTLLLTEQKANFVTVLWVSGENVSVNCTALLVIMILRAQVPCEGRR